jgi:hypothetical protein
MSTNPEMPVFTAPPSAWVKTIRAADQTGRPDTRPRSRQRSAFRAPAGESFVVYAVDCDVSALLPLAGPGCEVRQIDLETFARGNERFSRPHNPDFLLRPGEFARGFCNTDGSGLRARRSLAAAARRHPAHSRSRRSARALSGPIDLGNTNPTG